MDYNKLDLASAELNQPWLKISIIKMLNDKHWFANYYKGGRVLDVGGGDSVCKRLAGIQEEDYESLDNDKGVSPTHTSWKTVKGEFDYILMFSVVEHITIELFNEWLKEACQHLKPDGELIITTPNVYNLHVFHHDHKTFYKPSHLFGIVKLAGFKPKVYRCYYLAGNPFVRLVQILRTPFSYFFEQDFNVPNVMIIAKKMS